MLPREWKSALICPIHKSGSKNLVSNYRPISLLSIIMKLLEKSISQQLLNLVSKNGAIIPEQYGFCKGRSVNLQLVEVLNFITRALNAGKSMDVFYFDFKKAFDKVPHRRLLLKLWALGVRDSALKWFENYLTDRVQLVRIRDAVSSQKGVLSGFPQGSILGPLLFLIYVADLPRVISLPSKIRMFADDTKIFREISGKDDELELQKDLENIFH